jgi:hypothetical protein
MIELIMDLLKDAPKYKSEAIDFAKGKQLLPSKFKELKQYAKWQLRK